MNMLLTGYKYLHLKEPQYLSGTLTYHREVANRQTMGFISLRWECMENRLLLLWLDDTEYNIPLTIVFNFNIVCFYKRIKTNPSYCDVFQMSLKIGYYWNTSRASHWEGVFSIWIKWYAWRFAQSHCFVTLGSIVWYAETTSKKPQRKC